MFLPIGDENPRERTPYVNFTLLAANIAVFLLFCFPEPRERVVEIGALYPAKFEWHALFTSMFLHANIAHLIGNMLFLWIFGDNVEDRLGHVGYLFFYAICGVSADFLHIAATNEPGIPMLGASGAISGVVGAYAVFFPRHQVKMLLWWFLYVQVIRIAAVWWIGIWFAEQIFFSQLGFGGVAYYAHIGGFLAGLAIAGAARLARSSLSPSRRVPVEFVGAARRRPSRTPFLTVEDDPGIQYIDPTEDRYAVLRLSDELHHVGAIAERTTEITREPLRDVARRLEATRGVIARGLPRRQAELIQRGLHPLGIPAALIVDTRANFPPSAAYADAVSWDDRTIRFRREADVTAVPWTAPFLYVGARIGRRAFADVFVNRRGAFRVPETGTLTAVDARRRREMPADLAGFAKAVLERSRGAAANEGIRVLAHRGAWGWLAFRDPGDYDDYLFWIYNLILSRVPLHKA
jgi:membrane associated rhomboid family serine protease